MCGGVHWALHVPAGHCTRVGVCISYCMSVPNIAHMCACIRHCTSVLGIACVCACIGHCMSVQALHIHAGHCTHVCVHQPLHIYAVHCTSMLGIARTCACIGQSLSLLGIACIARVHACTGHCVCMLCIARVCASAIAHPCWAFHVCVCVHRALHVHPGHCTDVGTHWALHVHAGGWGWGGFEAPLVHTRRRPPSGRYTSSPGTVCVSRSPPPCAPALSPHPQPPQTATGGALGTPPAPIAPCWVSLDGSTATPHGLRGGGSATAVPVPLLGAGGAPPSARDPPQVPETPPGGSERASSTCACARPTRSWSS
eukprot:XP_027327989.1 uncharacterized protein LOC113845623 [Anas platyrhynchos]